VRELQEQNTLALQRIAEFTIRHLEAEAYVKKLLDKYEIELPSAYYSKRSMTPMSSSSRSETTTTSRTSRSTSRTESLATSRTTKSSSGFSLGQADSVVLGSLQFEPDFPGIAISSDAFPRRLPSGLVARLLSLFLLLLLLPPPPPAPHCFFYSISSTCLILISSLFYLPMGIINRNDSNPNHTLNGHCKRRSIGQKNIFNISSMFPKSFSN
jgi:hypothetical protein